MTAMAPKSPKLAERRILRVSCCMVDDVFGLFCFLGCLFFGGKEFVFEETGSVGFGAVDELFGGAGEDNAAAVTAAFGTHVDDPVGDFDDVGVMFDDNDAMATFDEAVEG